MLRLMGILLLIAGSAGMGLGIRERLRGNLEGVYQIRHIFQLFQNEITYSRASLPEACLRISKQVKEPYRSTLEAIHREMMQNAGRSFAAVWEKHMEGCMHFIQMEEEDKRVFLEFGNCAGHRDGQMQAQIIEQYMHRLDISVGRMEKDLSDKCRIAVTLSVMGGLMLVILLI